MSTDSSLQTTNRLRFAGTRRLSVGTQPRMLPPEVVFPIGGANQFVRISLCRLLISSLILCFIAGLPFVPIMIIFVGIENLLYLSWFLVFAYLISVIIALPIGAKYIGKKSDIMLLYSVTMILLIILGIGSFISVYIWNNLPFPIIPSILIILLEFVALYVSVRISDKILMFRKPISLDLDNS